jgi:hypothetical protein
MEKHEYIKWVEKVENKFFSECELPKINLDLNYFHKLDKVYIKSDVDKWHSQIFRSELFYLYLMRINQTDYHGILYYEIKNSDKINFYIQSLLKKLDNESNNITTS